ncbi:MAG: CBS domain-containing protein [Cyanobium sp.]
MTWCGPWLRLRAEQALQALPSSAQPSSRAPDEGPPIHPSRSQSCDHHRCRRLEALARFEAVASGAVGGELSEQDLLGRESGFQPGPYVMLLDAVIYLRNPLNWDKEVHQVLGSTVGDVMSRRTHTCGVDLPLPAAARQLHEGGTQRLFVLDGDGKLAGVLTRGDVVRALAAAEG